MTKKFALPDTLPTPYFTIDAGAGAALTVKLAPGRINDEQRMIVEVWRGQLPLCRVIGQTAELGDNHVEREA
jgi:hypothetical protein